ncbi:MAG: hypothetical protein Q9176_003709 [Flavoplaca citrina]
MSSKKVSLEGVVSLLRVHEFNLHAVDIAHEGTIQWPCPDSEETVGQINGIVVIYSISDASSTKLIPSFLQRDGGGLEQTPVGVVAGRPNRPRASTGANFESAATRGAPASRSKHQRVQSDYCNKLSNVDLAASSDGDLHDRREPNSASKSEKNHRPSSPINVHALAARPGWLERAVCDPSPHGVALARGETYGVTAIDECGPDLEHEQQKQASIPLTNPATKSGDEEPCDDSFRNNGVGFEELVDRLLSNTVTKSDLKFTAIFLCLYRKISAPSNLLTAVTSRFKMIDEDRTPQAVRNAAQLRYLGVLAQWVSEYPGDFAHPLTRLQLEDFISGLVGHRNFSMVTREIMSYLDVVSEDDDTAWACSDIIQSRTDAVASPSSISSSLSAPFISTAESLIGKMALEKCMAVAWRLRQLNNYNSLGAVVAGINGTAVHRLYQTRELVPHHVQKQFMRLEILMGTQKSHFAYRLAWSNTSTERIPFLPLHSRDLASAEEGNQTYIDEGCTRINWKKFEVIGEVVVSIQRSQATSYTSILRNEEVQRLILDSKFTKDDDGESQFDLDTDVRWDPGQVDDEQRNKWTKSDLEIDILVVTNPTIEYRLKALFSTHNDEKASRFTSTSSHTDKSQMACESSSRKVFLPILPNPIDYDIKLEDLSALKFLPNRRILPESLSSPYIEYLNPRSTLAPPYPSPLAAQLLSIDGIAAVFYGPDFITITKAADANWAHVKPEVFSLITEAVNSGERIVTISEPESSNAGLDNGDTQDSLAYNEKDSEVVGMIKELLETRIRPAIQEDGGDVDFCGFENGKVLLKLRGACRTCDSSTIEEVQGVTQVVDEAEITSNEEFARFEEKLRQRKGVGTATT